MATTTVGEHGAQPASSAPKPITDKYHLVQIVFFLHGISALLPWNMLINADSYFVDYKLNPDGPMFYRNEPSNNNLLSIDCRQFANQSDCLAHSAEVLSASSNGSSLLLSNSSSSISSQYIHQTSTSPSSPALANYRANFLPYLSTASKLPNIVFQLVNLLFSSSYVASSCRLVFAFYIQIGLFLLTISLALVDTSAWPEAFFWVTMFVAVCFNTVNGIYQSCIYGIGAKFARMRYTNAITLGFSFSGSIASMFLIVSLLLSPHPRTVAVLYFTFATVFMAVCLVNEYLVRRNAYLQYNVLLNETEEGTNGEQNFSLEEGDKKEDNNNLSSSSSKIDASTQVIFEPEITTSANLTTRQSYLLILGKSWLQLLNIVLIYFVSFSIFPAVQAAIRPVNALLPEKFFAPVFCFLFFNSWATLGNFVSERTMTPSPKHLHYLVLLRFLFIPFFLACNYLPSERKWAVTFSSDYIYAVGSASMAFTSGYTSALAMMYVPKSVPVKWASTAAMMASAAVIIGILAGVQFSIVLRHLVT